MLSATEHIHIEPSFGYMEQLNQKAQPHPRWSALLLSCNCGAKQEIRSGNSHVSYTLSTSLDENHLFPPELRIMKCTLSGSSSSSWRFQEMLRLEDLWEGFSSRLVAKVIKSIRASY